MAPGATLGTPDYMSPEQARDSRRADIRSDIYSLGCTLYYLLAGVVPFPVGTAMEKVMAHCERSPAPLADLRDDISSEVVHIVERMMAKDPTERMQTPKEVVEALRPFAILKPASEPPLAIETTRVDVSSPLDDTEARMHRTKAASTPNVLDTFHEIEPQNGILPREMRPLPRFATPHWIRWLQRHLILLIVAVTALIVLAAIGNKLLTDPNGKSSATVEGWIELIPQIDPTQHAVAGSWRRTGSELSVDAAESARLVLPHPAGSEYDFEIAFVRHSGRQSIALMFVMGTGQATFEVEAWNSPIAGIQRIDGNDMRDNGTQVAIPPLENGRVYTALVQVRRNRVEGYLDGKLLVTYRGDGSNLSPLKLWKLPDSQCLGLGAYRSATTFHRVRVRGMSN